METRKYDMGRGTRVIVPGPPATSQCPVEWCLFGRFTGEYIFECSQDPYALASKYGRETGDGTRMIRIVGSDMMHAHDSNGCIPRHILYKSARRQGAIRAVERSIVAGEQVIVL